MVVVMEVVDGGTVVVLLSVSQGLLGSWREVRHVALRVVMIVVLVLVERWVVELSMKTAMVVWAIIEVLTVIGRQIVVSVLNIVMVVTVLELVMLLIIVVLVLSVVLWLVVVG